MEQRARAILLAGEPMAIFPNYFVASPRRHQAGKDAIPCQPMSGPFRGFLSL